MAAAGGVELREVGEVEGVWRGGGKETDLHERAGMKTGKSSQV